MDIRELKEKKKSLGYSNEKIAELSGVPLSTVQKVFAGVTQQPRYDTLAALERALDPTGVREAVFQYGIDKKQGEYTIEDCEKLPEDILVELIDGVMYIITSPTLLHQELVGEFYIRLKEYIKKNGGQCRTMVSPVDVHIDKEDNKTLVKPDVFVVCKRDKFTRRWIEGSPDLVIEVLSPSTKRKDMAIKLKKYIETGVREYWLVDPDQRKIMVYDLENYDFPIMYTFEDKVHVGIFDGDCIIDMAEIVEDIGFFFDLPDPSEE